MYKYIVHLQYRGGKMAGWSSILRSTSQKLNGFSILLFKKPVFSNQVRCMSEHRVMNIQGSRWQWNKMKDMTHFYFLLGIIPCTLITIYAYVFVGPATLEPIPEGYEPKYWEYYRNPITRFMLRYINTNPQQEYEKYLNIVYLEQEMVKIRKLEARIYDLMEQREDHRYFFNRPYSSEWMWEGRDLKESGY